MTDLLIVGGGITGLSAAYIAAKNGLSVTVLEASEDFGGLLRTFPVGDGQLEHFYHHFFTHDAELRWLLKELHIEQELQFHPTTMGIFANGKLHPFNNARDVLRFSPIPFAARLRFGLSSLWLSRADWRKLEGISAIDWLQKNAGKAATKAIWEPLLNIKFGPEAAKVPAAWMAGRLSQRLRSRKAGDERLGYLNGSLQTLLDALLQALKKLGVQLVANAPVDALLSASNGIEGAQAAGQEYRAKQTLLTIPNPVAAPLIAPHNAPLASAVEQVAYFGAVCVVLEMSQPLSNTYWLNIADSRLPFGGVIEQTNLIAPANYGGRHIAYLSRYFTHNEAIAGMSKEAISHEFLQALPSVFPHFKPANVLKTHVFRSNTAAPVCGPNFSQKVQQAGGKTPLAGLFIANMMHVYPDERSTNNSIRVAAAVCNAMGINSSFVPHGPSLAGQIGL